MCDVWRTNVAATHGLVEENRGIRLAALVSGGGNDRRYWQRRLEQTRRDVFSADGLTPVTSVSEPTPKGNFLGTFAAWEQIRKFVDESGVTLPPVALMTMVFGSGKRLSPFTQALGNRKSAFPTPMRARQADTFLSIADVSNLYSNLWAQQLQVSGFRGVIVKWGDEAVVPGRIWDRECSSFQDVDAVRFVWKTPVTADLAREKDWVLINRATGTMAYQYARQEADLLRRRVAQLEPNTYEMGVNLGSVAVSRQFLDVGTRMLAPDLCDPSVAVDWDPYVWVALFCEDEAQWRLEAQREAAAGASGIHNIEKRYPSFFARIRELRSALESVTRRPFAVGVLDFGRPRWTDFGLHLTLRKELDAVVEASSESEGARELFRVPHTRDGNGNTLVNSTIPAGADIRDSLIIDSVIQSQNSVLHGALVLGGRHNELRMPYGGSALFCACDRLNFSGPHAIAFRVVWSAAVLAEGDRLASVSFDGKLHEFRSNESILDYSGPNYASPLFGNPVSFQALYEAVAAEDSGKSGSGWESSEGNIGS